MICGYGIILNAHARIMEILECGTVRFVHASPIAGFIQVKDHKQVLLMFNAE